MILHSMTATIGCLNNRTLDLEDGLNIIQAPNEAGKSTWSALVRILLYGLSTKERGALADKNRYAPWSGASMMGRADLLVDGKELVLVRDTVRANAPMGRFYAAYAGTATQVPDMTGANAGELLTGVPREVYERSAYIRQSGLAVEQSTELEKRISALISSGEEDTSYIETEKRLKKQLNARRHNRTGLLPALEEEEAQTRAALEEISALYASAEADRARIPALEQRRDDARAGAQRHEQMDRIEARRTLIEAHACANRSRNEADEARRSVERDAIPPEETLLRLQIGAANLADARQEQTQAHAAFEQAAAEAAAAQARVDASPFAGQTPNQAETSAKGARQRHDELLHSAAPSIPAIAVATAASAGTFGVLCYYFHMTPLLCLLAAAIAAMLIGIRLINQKTNCESAAKLLDSYGVDDPAALTRPAEDYAALCQTLTQKRDEEAAARAAEAALVRSEQNLRRELFAQISLFCTPGEDLDAVNDALTRALCRRRALAELDAAAQRDATRYETLRAQNDDETPLTAEEEALRRPAESRSELLQRAQEAELSLRELESGIDRLEGQMRATGDRGELRARAQAGQERHKSIQEEYDAIALALEVLGNANTELQTRFSPALGQRAGEILARITDGHYDKLVLDRNLSAAAEGAGERVPHSAQLLSQGAADQVYFAVRMAICDLVLPAENAAPLVLDDALTNFDDRRMRSALDYLREQAQQRQILLFTCQTREADYLQSFENVHIIEMSK